MSRVIKVKYYGCTKIQQWYLIFVYNNNIISLQYPNDYATRIYLSDNRVRFHSFSFPFWSVLYSLKPIENY